MAGAQLRAVLEDDVDTLLRVVAAVGPTLECRLQELRGDVLVVAPLEPGITGEDLVLEHPRANRRIVEVQDVEVRGLIQLAGGRVLGFEDLCVLVVDHRLGDVEVPFQQAGHVEVLLDDGFLGWVEPGLHESGE